MGSPVRLVPWGRCRGCRKKFPITELYDRAPGAFNGYCAACFSVYVPVRLEDSPVPPVVTTETSINGTIRGVYFIQGELSGLIKIGYSRNIVARICDLQSGSGEHVVLLGIVRGSSSIERNLHKRFDKYRRHGEWFEPDPVILKYVEQKTEKIDGAKFLRFKKNYRE